MEPLDAHRRAQEAFARALSPVGDGQLDVSTPCSEWKVRDLVHHVVSGNRRTAGLSVEPLPEGATGIQGAHAESAEAAQGAFAAPDGLTRSFELPFGSVPGSVYILFRSTDVLMHAWDLARATGQETPLDPELASELLAFSHDRISPEHRGSGRPFAEEQPCAMDRPAADRLAAFLGRSVS